VCPYLSGELVPRRPHDEPDIAIVGTTAAELAQVGRTVPKRPLVMAITRTYSTALYPAQVGDVVRVYKSGPPVRVRRFEYADGRLAEVTPSPPACPVRAVRTQRVTGRKKGGRR
jgi:hypothetical protein